MKCCKCDLVPNERGLVEPDWVGCVVCNADLMSFYPLEVTYVGHRDGKHFFRYDSPFTCPTCGTISEMMTMPCDREGGYYEVTAYQQSETLGQLVQE